MTAVPKNPRVSELRELFRNLNAFRAVYEETGFEDITTPEGGVWSIWDLEYLCQQLPRLTPRQQQAITLCLIHNMREKDAARAMGVSVTNPVMMYATLGLQRLLDMIDKGELTRYRDDDIELNPEDLRRDALVSKTRLVTTILGKVRTVSNGCWIYPNPSPGPPSLLVRTPQTSTGFTKVYPLVLLFEAKIGPVAPGSKFSHTSVIPPFSSSCVNPYHAVLMLPQERLQRIQAMAAAYQTVVGKRPRKTYEEMLEEYLASRKELVS